MKIRCSACDQLHDLSEIQIGYDRPDPWYAVHPAEREERWQMDMDLAILDGERFFIRGLVFIPVQGEEHPHAWGVWAAVDEADFRLYDALYEDPERHREPPFAGRIANQIAGYPQTLGLPVTIRLGSGNDRPSFVVEDAAHPLAAEQRGGVYVERVLEMVSPLLHRDRAEPAIQPRFATLEEDRWRVLDVAESWRSRKGPIWFPDEEIRSSVQPGGVAKLLWEIVASDAAGQAATHVERMWAHVDHREEKNGEILYSGTLANDPHNPGLTRFGIRVWFTPHHVADVRAGNDEPPASANAQVRCAGHGASFPAYVCGHLLDGEDQGFHAAEDPGNPRPDAWCDRCEAVRLREGGWSDTAEEFAGIALACGTCYDIIEANNRRE
ncbi:MAG: DUF2199 domain-containing protein [Gemmatimonadetes bacterium]|nr:DUF2199 domain-containing protein [Gemmatimonadota bacterium]